jgi:hypothetical protein
MGIAIEFASLDTHAKAFSERKSKELQIDIRSSLGRR